MLIGLSLVGSPLLPDSPRDALSDFCPDSPFEDDGLEDGDELGDGMDGTGEPAGLGDDGIGELLPGVLGIGELGPPELLWHPARPVAAASSTMASPRMP